MHEGADEQTAGAVERWARDRLTARGGGDLPRLPWLADGQPHDAVTLIRQALWRADTDRGALELPDDLLPRSHCWPPPAASSTSSRPACRSSPAPTG